jgi:hypothetical protein
VLQNNGTINVTVTGIAFDNSSVADGFSNPKDLETDTSGIVFGPLEEFGKRYDFDPEVQLDSGKAVEFTVNKFSSSTGGGGNPGNGGGGNPGNGGGGNPGNGGGGVDMSGSDLTFTVYFSDGSSAEFTITFP